MDVTEASIPELRAAMDAGRLTSVELVDAYLARIAAYDDAGPMLNAVIATNPSARQDAAALDRELADRGARGPLHGIPVLIKDNFDVAGMPTTGGSIALAEHMPLRDATQVRKLREAGAVILGKTNLHELAYGITTISSMGGQTRNPYALNRNPGGSSGGTGAAIAAGFAAIGWGTDTCGSIRIPASANRLFGLRPTKGLSSIEGILPLAHSQDAAGPIARTMIDLAIGLDATIGPDPDDPATAVLEGRPLPRFVEADRPGALRGARIGVLTHYFGNAPAEEPVNAIVRDALAVMADLGAELVDVTIPGFDEIMSGTSLIEQEFKWDLADYLSRTPNPPVRGLTDILDRELYHPAVEALLRRADIREAPDSTAIAEIQVRRDAAARAVQAFMDENRLDALAYPTLRRPPAIIGDLGIGNNCQLSAATGFPALAVPAGFAEDGVPVGFELMGRAFADEMLMAYGFEYERTLERVPPDLSAVPD